MSTSNGSYISLRERNKIKTTENGTKETKSALTDEKKVLNNLLNNYDAQISGNLQSYLNTSDNLRRSTLKDSKVDSNGDDSSLQKKTTYNKTVVEKFENGKKELSITAERKTPEKRSKYSYYEESKEGPTYSNTKTTTHTTKTAPILTDTKLLSRNYDEKYDLNNVDRIGMSMTASGIGLSLLEENKKKINEVDKRAPYEYKNSKDHNSFNL